MNCQEIVYNNVQAYGVSFRWRQCQSIMCELPHNDKKSDILSLISISPILQLMNCVLGHIDELRISTKSWTFSWTKVVSYCFFEESLGKGRVSLLCILFIFSLLHKWWVVFCNTSSESTVPRSFYQRKAVLQCHSKWWPIRPSSHCCSSTIDEL